MFSKKIHVPLKQKGYKRATASKLLANVKIKRNYINDNVIQIISIKIIKKYSKE